ncbi:MAG: MATE family efflux transporter [Oscillospiraceae bacterium]|nr:MATE family efflux transporter [Oscillospiraceae bacterium]
MTYLKQGRRFYRSAVALMIPMILQNFIMNAMSLADTFMVGALGELPLAAVSLANTPMFIVMLIGFGLQSGCGVLTAQYYGKGDKAAINRVLGMGLYAALIVTFAVAAAAVTVPEGIMRVLTNNEDLVGPGAAYLRIAGPSHLFTGVGGIYIATQRSMGNPMLGALTLTGSSLLNIFLNWVLIFGNLGAPAMGVEGAALATLISRICELCAVVVYALFFDKRLPLKPGLILRPGREMLHDGVRYVLPVVLNEALWSAATSLYSVIMGHMEDSAAILAAFTIAGNLERVLSVGLFAAGGATAVIIGRDIGAGETDKVYGRGVALCVLSAAVGVVSSIIVLIVRFTALEPLIFPLLGLSEGARGYGMFIMTAVAAVLPLRALNIALITGVFRSGGDVRYALFCDVLPMFLVCVPAAAVTGLILKWGLHAVYTCICFEEVIKIFINIPRLVSRKWINDVTR